MVEELVAVTNSFEIGKPDSLVVVIPKKVRARLNLKRRQHFKVKVDERGRIIYEPIWD